MRLHLSDPPVDVELCLDFATLTLTGQTVEVGVVLHHLRDARALHEALHKVMEHLEAVEHREARRLDKAAAREMERPEGPTLQLTQAPAVSRVVSIPISACACSRFFVCEEHLDSGGAA